MPDGASQSAIDLRCNTARDPQKALHPNQTRMPWPGCCFSRNCMLSVIIPECAVAWPLLISLNCLIPARTAPGLGRVSWILVVLAVGHRRQPCPHASGCHLLHLTASRALYTTSGQLSTCSKKYMFASCRHFLVRICHFSAAMPSAATGRF